MAHRWFPDEIYFEKDAKDLYALNRQEGHACLVLLQGIYAGGLAGIEHVEVDRAYEVDAGHLIFTFDATPGKRDQEKNPDFMGHSLTFFGAEDGLYQVESSDSYPGGHSDYRHDISFMLDKSTSPVATFYAGDL